MTNEELNTKLYQKMESEQKQYRDWLLTQPPAEILHHTCEYTVREDILMAMENLSLSNRQCRALLKSSSPLADIHKEYEKRESDYMSDLADTIECRANAIIRQDFLKSRQEER